MSSRKNWYVKKGKKKQKCMKGKSDELEYEVTWGTEDVRGRWNKRNKGVWVVYIQRSYDR